MNLYVQKVKRALTLTQHLVEYIAEEHLQLRLGNLPSNTIGEQLWCVVGARESYLAAMKNEQWVSFTCSLQDTRSKKAVIEAVSTSQQAVLDFIEEETLSEVQLGFLLDLLEHEIQHHGQLIRYMYGNRLGFPQSWHDRYTV
jgi:hypothetical protein